MGCNNEHSGRITISSLHFRSNWRWIFWPSWHLRSCIAGVQGLEFPSCLHFSSPCSGHPGQTVESLIAVQPVLSPILGQWIGYCPDCPALPFLDTCTACLQSHGCGMCIHQTKLSLSKLLGHNMHRNFSCTFYVASFPTIHCASKIWSDMI